VTGPAGLRRFVRPGAAAAPGESDGGAVPVTAPAPATTQSPPLPSVLQMPQLQAPSSPDANPDAERCEMCAAEIPAEHGHVADLENSTLACACRACYLLFTQPSAGRGRYRSVPDRYLSDPGRTLTPAQWDQLEVPVGLAFFLKSSSAERVAGFYPSPAGVTECILDLAAWERLTEEYPLLGATAADVEAALICRTDAGIEYFLVPIDACYELAGRMRLYWRGFDGGAEARSSIADFLDTVRGRARPFRASAGQAAGAAPGGAA
jgi:Family of unknown function (DUF5947)